MRQGSQQLLAGLVGGLEEGVVVAAVEDLQEDLQGVRQVGPDPGALRLLVAPAAQVRQVVQVALEQGSLGRKGPHLSLTGLVVRVLVLVS